MKSRALLLVGGTALAGPAAWLLGGPASRRVASAAGEALRRRDLDVLTALPLDDAVAGICGIALLTATGIWTLGVVLALAESLLGGRAARWAHRAPCPSFVRALALGTLGASLAVGGTAVADPPQGAGAASSAPATGRLAALSGLPLPDRVATTPPATARTVARPAPAVVRVRPGDTLWSIAACRLPPAAPAAAIDAAWRRIAAANRDTVPDPDLILPGTALRVPPTDPTADSHREDLP